MLDSLRRLFQNEHEYAQENLSAYLDGELDAREKNRVEKHLQECTICQRELAGLRQTVALLRLVPEVPLPRSFLVPVAEARPQPVRARQPALTLVRSASLIATFMFVVVLTATLALPRGYGAPLGMGGAPEAAFLQESESPVRDQTEPQRTEVAALPQAPQPAPRVVETVVVEAAPAESTMASKAAPMRAPLGGEEASAAPTSEQVAAQTEALTVRNAAASEETPVATEAADTGLKAAAEAAPTDEPAIMAAKRAPSEAEQPVITTALQRVEREQMIRDILNALMWALFLTTVTLWSATALLSRRR